MHLLPARRRAHEELLLARRGARAHRRRPGRRGRDHRVAQVRARLDADAHLEVALQRAQRREPQLQQPVLAREVQGARRGREARPVNVGVVVVVADVRVRRGGVRPARELLGEQVEDEVDAAHEVELDDHAPGSALGLPLVLAVRELEVWRGDVSSQLSDLRSVCAFGHHIDSTSDTIVVRACVHAYRPQGALERLACGGEWCLPNWHRCQRLCPAHCPPVFARRPPHGGQARRETV